MARGITESDVHSAADAIVDAGERPTVERIRAHLGTGSPNTVTRWLETWWQGLGQRLQAQQASLSSPDAPDAVGKVRSEEHTPELQSLMRITYAVFCLTKTTHMLSSSSTNTYRTTQSESPH